MSRNKPATVTGVLIVNKHEGVTSHKIVSILRKLYDMPKVGHTGTLDPLATGVLPILLGRAVKAADFLLAEDKCYTAELKLGITTDTQDVTGEILTECGKIPSEEEVRKVCEGFTGDIMQVPPMYSAIKVDGRKLCDLAREGAEVKREARPVTIYSLKCEKITDDVYRLYVHCSKGTYIRTLCADIGEALGCGGVMKSLCRTRSGPFDLSQSITIEELSQMEFEERLKLPKPTESLFEDLPKIQINDFYTKLIKGGTELYQKKLGTSFEEGAVVRIRHNNSFIALGRVMEFEGGSAVKPIKLFEL